MVNQPTPAPGSPAYCPRSLDHRHVWRAGDAKRNGVGGWDFIVACACCEVERSFPAEVVQTPQEVS